MPPIIIVSLGFRKLKIDGANQLQVAKVAYMIASETYPDPLKFESSFFILSITTC